MTDRRIDLSVEVPGTPEEVWDTIATSAGITSWFHPVEVEEREGGAVTFDWGEAFGKEQGRVTAWEPPTRFAYESGDEEGLLAYEWLVEARSGGTCVVRLVNSGFGAGDKWDEQYHGMLEGWVLFMENLRLRLTYFRGRAARAAIPTVQVPGPNEVGWALLCDAVGVPADLQVGDRLATTDGGVPALAGTVEHVFDRPAAKGYALVTDTPGPGTAFLCAEGTGEQASISVYTYLPDDVPDEWTAWMLARFKDQEPLASRSPK